MTILDLADPGDRFPMVTAFWRYARSMAYIRKGKLTDAIVELQSLEKIRAEADLSGLVAGYVPAPELLDIARLVLEGRIARAHGDMAGAIKVFEAAVAIQDSIPYMEPPYWYYPVRQTLAATHLMNGHGDKAEALFRASLEESPNNGWALFGLLRCQEATGKVQAAAKTRAQLDAVWLGERTLLQIERL